MKKFEVNVDKALELGIMLESYCVALTIHHNPELDVLLKYAKNVSGKESINKTLNDLVARGYLTNTYHDKTKYMQGYIHLTEKFKKDILEPYVKPLEDWFDSWHALWPPKQKNLNGDYIKGDKSAAKTRLAKLMENNPKFTKGAIIAATKQFLVEQANKGFAYCPQAHYFVMKDGVSRLASGCEALLSNEKPLDDSTYEEDRL